MQVNQVRVTLVSSRHISRFIKYNFIPSQHKNPMGTKGKVGFESHNPLAQKSWYWSRYQFGGCTVFEINIDSECHLQQFVHRLVGLSRRAKIIVSIDIITPPRGERNRRTTGPEDGKGKDEEHCETGTVKRARNQVRVVLEDARVVVAQVVLDEEAGWNLVEDDAGLRPVVWDVPCILDELGEVEIR